MVNALEIDAPPKKGHRDPLRAFYTDDCALVAYMADLLAPEPNDQCLEPCAGSGLFIDELVSRHPSIQIDAIEIEPAAIETLRQRFRKSLQVKVLQGDYLAVDTGRTCSIKYDKIIANPPYGAWQTPKRRSELKLAYPDLYVKESATLFLAKAIASLRVGGRAVFILPETFLFSHSHRPLRKRILENCAVESIDVFPSSLFPGVNFGYARLSILSLKRVQSSAGHRCIVRQASTMPELVGKRGIVSEYDQAAILNAPELSFPINGSHPLQLCESARSVTLGDLADCVTGFYSGDDAKFLRRAPTNAKYSNRYPLVHPGSISLDQHPPLTGLSGPGHFIPVVKGGGYAYLKPTMWYMDWSESAVRHFRTDRKARFQNSSFYFRQGIGFPMVSSGGARATVIRSHQLFDQSVVGIFPKTAETFGFLLAYLNSSTAWRLLRQINPSTNNSAKYMRRLPVVLPSTEELNWFSRIVDEYIGHLANNGSPDEVLERALDARVQKAMETFLPTTDDASQETPPK